MADSDHQVWGNVESYLFRLVSIFHFNGNLNSSSNAELHQVWGSLYLFWAANHISSTLKWHSYLHPTHFLTLFHACFAYNITAFRPFSICAHLFLSFIITIIIVYFEHVILIKFGHCCCIFYCQMVSATPRFAFLLACCNNPAHFYCVDIAISLHWLSPRSDTAL